jgi:hypothetical protein
MAHRRVMLIFEALPIVDASPIVGALPIVEVLSIVDALGKTEERVWSLSQDIWGTLKCHPYLPPDLNQQQGF